MDDTVSEVLSLIGMEDYLRPLLIGKGRTGRNQLLIHLHPPCLLLPLIPDEQAHLFDIFKRLAQVILVNLFALALIEVALDRILLDLGHVDPPAVVPIMRCLAEHIILQYFLMLVLGEDAIEGLALLYPSFFVVEEAFEGGLDGRLCGEGSDGVEDFLGVFGVCVGRGVGVGEFEEIGKDGYLGGRRVLSEVFLQHLQHCLHSTIISLYTPKTPYSQKLISLSQLFTLPNSNHHFIGIMLTLFIIVLFKMKKLIMILSVILLLQACHYSCFNCTGPQYISCLSCPNGSAISVVQDPSTTPAAYWSSVYQTGTCVDTTAGKTNALGILLFIILSVSCVVIGTKESFYLFLTIQTFGLYNLVEIAWVNPIGYLLQAMQHLMIWNIMGAGYKSADYTFIAGKYFRLNTFLKQTVIGQNILLIGIFTIIAMVLLIVICLVAVHRKKQEQKEEEEKEEQRGDVIFEHFQQEPEKPQGPTCMQRFSEKVLIQVGKFLLSVLYMMAQQTALVLLVSLVFRLNKVVIILSIIYLHILIFTMSYAYYYRVEYFKEKNVMYINFAKKVVLPIMVVLPLGYKFLFFLFAAVIVVVEFLIDCYNGLYKKFSRLAFYKVLELMIVVLLIVYYLVEQTGGKYSSSRAAAIACTFVIAFYLFVFVAVEVPLGVKERFFSNKKDQKDQLMLEDKNATQEFFVENLKERSSNSRGQKDDNLQVVEMSSSKSQGSQDQEANPQPQEKITKDDNTSVKQSIAQFKPQEPAKPQPPKKKRRKQILDKQLRMRYGI